MPLQSIATKQVLLLRAQLQTYYVCDEYWPSDNRVHILGEHCYGTFNRNTFVLDFRKTAIDISAIVYEGADWPAPISGSKSIPDILAHFGRPNV